jgi:hypothetical protein
MPFNVTVLDIVTPDVSTPARVTRFQDSIHTRLTDHIPKAETVRLLPVMIQVNDSSVSMALVNDVRDATSAIWNIPVTSMVAPTSPTRDGASDWSDQDGETTNLDSLLAWRGCPRHFRPM